MAPPSASPTPASAAGRSTVSNGSSSLGQPVSTQNSRSTATSEEDAAALALSFADRIRAAEHRFTSLTQNIAHFSPLKTQLDKHNLAIERLESEIKKKTALLQSCQEKLKAASRRPQTSRQGSHVSLHASEGTATEALLVQQAAAKEAVVSLNGQLLAAKILHIGLTRQVTQYFESRSELQTLLEQIFSGTTPDHPSEDALERELEQISAEIVQVKEDFEKHRLAKQEFKEIRRYVDIWNDAIEKQIASNAKDVTKSFKKFVPFRGPKPPSYTKIADAHMINARTFVPTLDEIGLLSDIKMDTPADTSSELIIYTAKFKDSYNALSHALEVLHKRSRVLKRKKYQVIEKLFDERCKIVSVELQAHYRSIGERLAGGSGSAGADDRATVGGSAMHRQHVESTLDAYSRENSNTLGHNPQERQLDAEELPSYFQHQSSTTLHRRTGSLGSPAHSSSASSSLSLNSPLQFALNDSPPDYVRTEPFIGELGLSGGGGGGGGHAEEDEDAMFRAYHQRYDTRQRQASNPPTTTAGVTATAATTAVLDTPPGYDETQYHSVVDPV